MTYGGQVNLATSPRFIVGTSISQAANPMLIYRLIIITYIGICRKKIGSFFESSYITFNHFTNANLDNKYGIPVA